MIVLDPDLDPDPAPSTAANSFVSENPLKSTAHRVPSARVLARYLSDAQAAVRLRGEVTVLLTTDAAIRRLNRRFRGKNKPTDVLSFPAGPMPGAAIAGDLAISIPTARRQAAEQGHSLAVEIKVLVLHGLLHLAGYDHETDDGKMARRERLLRAKLGLPQGLIERAGEPTAAGSRSNAKPPSGAKARNSNGQANVRAEARTLRPGKPPSRVPVRKIAPPIFSSGKPRKPAAKKAGPTAGGGNP